MLAHFPMIPPRILELCKRLTSPGPIAGKLSASEHHEIVEFIMGMENQDPLSAGEILEMANEGDEIPPSRTLATYAERGNWVQVYNGELPDGKKASACMWAWCGPVVPPFELAQNTLKAE